MSKSKAIWEEDLGEASPKTAYIYTKIFDEFLEWAGLDHETLFTMHFEALKSDDPRDRQNVWRLVKSFRDYMVEERGLSTAYSAQIRSAVTRFMGANGLEFVVIKDRFKIINEGQDRATKKHIQAMSMATSEPRNRALLMTLKDSGLRVSDVVQLNVGDVRNGDDFVLVRVAQVKTKNMAKPCLGPDALESIHEWLKSRERRGGAFTDESPLFTDTEGSGKFVHRLDKGGVSRIIRWMALQSSLENISAHSLRKYHQTRLEASNISDAWIALLQGRKIRDSRGAYSLPTDEELLEGYAKAYEELQIHPTTDANTRLEEVEKDLQELKDILVITQGMIMDEKGLDNRDDLVTAFNEYVQKMLREKESPPNK